MDERVGNERARLVGAAWTVLRRSGFDGFKVQLVLKESGLSARTFYRHFPDKDSLTLALVEDEYAAMAHRLRRSVAGADDDPAEQVAAWIGELLQAAADPARAPRTRLFSSYHGMIGRAPGALSRLNELMIEPLTVAIERGKETGTFRVADPHGDAQQVARLAGGAIAEYLASGGGVDIDELTRTTVEFTLRAMSGPTPA